jgi:ATP-dependent DNA helicase DinG
VNDHDDGLVEAVARAFAADGPLAQADPGFIPRPQQDELAAHIAQALQERGTLVAEAGTGVGKTFAYLVPLLLSGRRALVSTATKSLQDQLFLRDLPRLAEALKTPLRLALLKGRASYLCRWRLQQAQTSGQLPDRFALRALNRVASWAQATRSGDLAEIEGLDERSPVIPLVTSTRDNCLGTECPEHRACHVMQARREAMAHRRRGRLRRGTPAGGGRRAVPRHHLEHGRRARTRARPAGRWPAARPRPAGLGRSAGRPGALHA